MGRLRTLKPEFFTHESLCELGALHRLLYAGLWCYADREGRLEDRPRYLKTVILPYDNCDVDAMLADLEHRGFIVRYEAGEKSCIAIPAFHRHQRPHPKERPSELPPPPVGAFSGGPRLATPPQGTAITHAAEMPGKGTTKPRKSTVEPGKDQHEQCGLGDLGLGDLGGGDLRALPVTEHEVATVLTVYEYFRENFHRRQLTPSAEERDAILARLREGYDATDQRQAIDGLRNSTWHRKRGFNALRYALADRDTVERCMEWAINPPDEATSDALRADPNGGILRGAS